MYFFITVISNGFLRKGYEYYQKTLLFVKGILP